MTLHAKLTELPEDMHYYNRNNFEISIKKYPNEPKEHIYRIVYESDAQ